MGEAHKSAASESDEISQFLTMRRWLEANRSEALPSIRSIQVAIQRHCKALAASGQLLLRRGRYGHLLGPYFGDVVLACLRDDSTRRADSLQRAKRSRDRRNIVVQS